MEIRTDLYPSVSDRVYDIWNIINQYFGYSSSMSCHMDNQFGNTCNNWRCVFVSEERG
jgi:hypothetical protein